jgi:hypothetical protein
MTIANPGPDAIAPGLANRVKRLQHLIESVWFEGDLSGLGATVNPGNDIPHRGCIPYRAQSLQEEPVEGQFKFIKFCDFSMRLDFDGQKRTISSPHPIGAAENPIGRVSHKTGETEDVVVTSNDAGNVLLGWQGDGLCHHTFVKYLALFENARGQDIERVAELDYARIQQPEGVWAAKIRDEVGLAHPVTFLVHQCKPA